MILIWEGGGGPDDHLSFLILLCKEFLKEN